MTWTYDCSVSRKQLVYGKMEGTKISRNFIQSLQATGGIILRISTQKPPSTLFPIHYSLIILTFGSVEPEIQLASLNKHQYHTNKGGLT